MSKITFAKDAWDEYLYWQTNDKSTVKRINTLLKSIQRDPFGGEGKPEHLRGSVNWSRRINEKDRLVYEVTEESIIVKQCKGHYDDK